MPPYPHPPTVHPPHPALPTPRQAIAHPDDAHSFYTDILTKAVKEWNMEMLFTDFVSDRGDALSKALPDTFEAMHLWFQGMVTAAADLGLETQVAVDLHN